MSKTFLPIPRVCYADDKLDLRQPHLLEPCCETGGKNDHTNYAHLCQVTFKAVYRPAASIIAIIFIGKVKHLIENRFMSFQLRHDRGCSLLELVQIGFINCPASANEAAVAS